MKGKVIGMFGVAAAVGLFGVVPSSVAQIDNSNATVHCSTVTKGVIKFSPGLVAGGALPAAIKISGTLGGCTSSDPGIAFPEGKSKFKGILNAPTNDCASLAGASPTTGTLTFTWKTVPAVTQKISTVTIPPGGSVGGIVAIGPDLYGRFGLGAPEGAAALSVTGGFTGGDGGAGSSGLVVTQQSIVSVTTYCAPPLALKAINIGVSGLTLQ